VLGAATVLILAAVWSVAGWRLWQTTVPGGLELPHLDARDYLTGAQLHRADSYERFERVNWVLTTIVLFGVLAWYAVRGARFARESAAGPIGTGMLLAMLGFGLVWLVQVPFHLVGNWWERRHGVSKVGYAELLFGGWFALGVEFLFLSFAVLIVMGLAGIFGDRWWIPGSAIFIGLAALFVFISPYTVVGEHGIRDPQLAADVRRIARLEGVAGVPVAVQDVDSTSSANAYATGVGPSRKVFLWNTLLDGRFTGREVRVVVAHEFGHQARGHLWKGIAWYALFAIPGAWVIARVTRRRGGMRAPEAVPLALLTLAVLTFLAQPLENVISRHMEAEADWRALETTRDPEAATSLFRRFSITSLSDPTPPGWAYALLETHPPILDRIEMAQAWKARHPGARPLFPSGQ
jgi:Zn-dependent protease with chaperone function